MPVLAVITKLPDKNDPEEREGNLYDHMVIVDINGNLYDNVEDLPQEIRESHGWRIESIKMETFTLGEILVLSDGYGREVSGHGRKPGKWYVDYEIFELSRIDDAIKRAIEVRGW